MKVYTKQGDTGNSYSLKSKSYVSKGSEDFELFGKLDKAMAFIGLLYVDINDVSIKKDLDKIIMEMHNLYTLFLSNPKFDPSITYYLEERIDAITNKVTIKNEFLMETFTSKKAALANICRVIIRELEREAVRQNLNKEAIAFLNRLSDYFFMLVILWEVNQKTYKDLLTK